MNWRHIIIVFLALATARAAQTEEPAPPATPGETRYSLSVAEEGTTEIGLRVPGPQTANLFLAQASFAYRRGQRWRLSTSLAGTVHTLDDTETRGYVKETYFGFSAGNLDFTAGKRIVRWGTGYAFTATGVLDPPRVSTDPTDRFNLNEGREMAKVDYTRGSHQFTIALASAGLSGHRAGARDTSAFRYNVMFHGFDTSVVLAHDFGGRSFAGANFTRVLGSAWEVHGELAWRQRGALLLGGKFTTASGVTFIAEYYTPVTGIQSPSTTPQGRPHYGFLRVNKSRLRELPGWKEWDVAAALVANLDDSSRICVFDVARRMGDHFTAHLRAETPAGRQRRSEYGMIPYSASLSAGIRFQI